MIGDTETSVFTAEQREYVDGVADCNLRQALLHHIRLRDLLGQDRDKFEKKCYALEDELRLLKEQSNA